jgi:hypothetical protein
MRAMSEQQIRGRKINADEAVKLLNKWRTDKLKVTLAITYPEITTMLTIVVAEVDFPKVTVTLANNAYSTILINFSGSLLERFAGDYGVGTLVRASWRSFWIFGTVRQISIAETTEETAAC